jgi:hypothetical protein
MRKPRCCSFDLPPEALALRGPEDEAADRWYRQHFRVNGRPLP